MLADCYACRLTEGAEPPRGEVEAFCHQARARLEQDPGATATP